MTDVKKALFFRAIGIIISTLPPFFAVISYFPIWRSEGAEAILSGLSLLLVTVSFVPLMRAIKRILSSPSAPIIWLVIFIVFFALSKIADDVTVIAFVGFVSNLIGAVFFMLARKAMGNEKNEKQT